MDTNPRIINDTTQAHKYSKFRLGVVLLFISGSALLLLGKAVWLQLGDEIKLDRLASRQFGSKMLLRPRRGMILDRNGEPLVVNREVKSLALDPSRMEQPEKIINLIHRALHIPVVRLKKKIDLTKSFVWVKRHLTQEQETALVRWNVIRDGGAAQAGVIIVREQSRNYPHQELALPVLGAVDIDAEGTSGIELQFERKLKGNLGSLAAVRDARGRPAFIEGAQSESSTDGESVQLSLDVATQQIVEDEAHKTVMETQAKAAGAIVLDAQTGELLAMGQALSPALQSNAMEKMRQRAITDMFEPGSTAKAMLVTAALKKGMLLSTSIDTEGGKVTIQKRTIREAHAGESYGVITLSSLLERSSNVASAKLAIKLGADWLLSQYREFGMGQRTGVEFPGENPGRLVESASKVQPIQLATIGFGQSFTASLLQIVRFYGAIANGGTLVDLTLLQGQRGQRKRILSSRIWTEIRSALLLVTEGQNGTAKNAQLEGFRIAGKTGTAQVVDSKTKRYSKDQYFTSFAGFPVGTPERLVVLAWVDQPKGNYYAAQTAVPLFRNIMSGVLSRFNVRPTEEVKLAGRVSAPSPEAHHLGSKSVDQSANVDSAVAAEVKPEWKLLQQGGQNSYVVPDLAGLSKIEALGSFQGIDLRPRLLGSGVVVEQRPRPGAIVTAGAGVDVRFGSQ